MPTAIDYRHAHHHLGITVESVSAQHDHEYCEKGNGQTRVKDGLDVDKAGIRASLLRESGSGTSRGVPKLGVGDNRSPIERNPVGDSSEYRQ